MENHLQVAEIVANMLDNRFGIAGIRFGAGAFIELMPEIGDVLILFLSLYLVWIGLKMKIPSIALAQMLGNVLLVSTLGTIPVAGDLVYILYRANMKNLAILKKYASEPMQGKSFTAKVAIQQQP